MSSSDWITTNWISSVKESWKDHPVVIAKLDELQIAFSEFEIVGLDTSTMSESAVLSILDSMLNIDTSVVSDNTSNLKTVNDTIYDLIDELSYADLLGDPTERFITMLTICKADLAGAETICDSLQSALDTKTAACICSFYNKAFNSKEAGCLCNPKHPEFHA
jgi:hypothetical protein